MSLLSSMLGMDAENNAQNAYGQENTVLTQMGGGFSQAMAGDQAILAGQLSPGMQQQLRNITGNANALYQGADAATLRAYGPNANSSFARNAVQQTNLGLAGQQAAAATNAVLGPYMQILQLLTGMGGSAASGWGNEANQQQQQGNFLQKLALGVVGQVAQGVGGALY